VGNVECHISPEPIGNEFYFHCAPYYLHLIFPEGCSVIDHEDSEKEMKAKYDPNDRNGTLVISIWKEMPNKHFPDLDLVTKLLQKKQSNEEKGDNENNEQGRRRSIPTIQEISSQNFDDPQIKNVESLSENSLLEINPTADMLNIVRPKYGFANRFQNVFAKFEQVEFLEIPHPDNIDEKDRMRLRRQVEVAKFDPERYLSDNIPPHLSEDEEEDYMLQMALQMNPFWDDFPKDSMNYIKANLSTQDNVPKQSPKLNLTTVESNVNTTSNICTDISLTETERDILMQIPNISIPASLFPSSSNTCLDDSMFDNEYFQNSLSSVASVESHLYSLLDILYAYIYDHRTTDGEPTCESPWTISILSPTLSWFETYRYLNSNATSTKSNSTKTKDDTLQENDHSTNEDVLMQILQQSIRRTLIYPLLRNYNLAFTIITKDIPQILSQGRRGILKCLIQIRSIMDHSDVYYWNTKLYLNGFCLWMQMLEEDVITDFYNSYQKQVLERIEGKSGCRSNSLAKDSLGLNINELENRFYYGIGIESEDDEEGVNSEDQYDSSSGSESIISSSDESNNSKEDALNTPPLHIEKHTSNVINKDKTMLTSLNEAKMKLSHSLNASKPSPQQILCGEEQFKSLTTSNALLHLEDDPLPPLMSSLSLLPQKEVPNSNESESSGNARSTSQNNLIHEMN